MWPSVKNAAQWQIGRTQKNGLPHNQNNTYDWWAFEKQDAVSYNAFHHLTALAAVEKSAKLQGDPYFADQCQAARKSARKAMEKLLWNGKFYLAHKNLGKEQETLMSDTLYGQLWAFILDLGLLTDKDRMLSRLASEQEINGTRFGLKVIHTKGRQPDALPGMLIPEDREKPRDEIVWEAGSLDWASLMLYLPGDTGAALAKADKILYKWQGLLSD